MLLHQLYIIFYHHFLNCQYRSKHIKSILRKVCVMVNVKVGENCLVFCVFGNHNRTSFFDKMIITQKTTKKCVDLCLKRCYNR